MATKFGRWSVVVATTNRVKLAELTELLADVPVDLVGVEAVLSKTPTFHDDGATLEENAMSKVTLVAQKAKMVAIAEDSGLEVDALNGRPGVRSARFAKEGATDAENNAAVLAALQDVEDDERNARYRCVLALVDPWSTDKPRFFEGRCEGVIARQTRGTGGFGYDPLFLVNGYDRTMAELDEAERKVVSHRARAVASLKEALVQMARERQAEVGRVVNVAGAPTMRTEAGR